jgi:hypothetical protein
VDQLNLERLGVPTVSVVTNAFMTLAKTVAAAEKDAHACIVDIPHPVGIISTAEVRAKADAAFEMIFNAATEWEPSSVGVVKSAAAYPAEELKISGSVIDIGRYFFERGWSLGLPIVPPTRARVAEILSGTRLRAEEVLGNVPPQNGTLTVELVAVHAAMAGCEPEYMPVLIAALKGFLELRSNWRGALATTGTSQMVVLVNGPIVKKLGIACGQGAAGKGNRANASIGYALNLIAYAVGGSRPPDIDRSTLGSPADYVCWVFGENEDRLPPGWTPLHVDQGFAITDSVVTVMASYPPVENIDYGARIDEHVTWWKYIINGLSNLGAPVLPILLAQNPLIAIGPEHADLIAGSGWTKDDFRGAFWENTRIPLSAWPGSGKSASDLEKVLGPMMQESLIPICEKAEQIQIVIAGGDGKHSHYFGPFPGCFPVSRLIEL